MKEYLDPCSSNIGLNPDSKQTHVQPDEKDLAAAHHMNNNKMSMDKKRTPNHLLSCKLSRGCKASL